MARVAVSKNVLQWAVQRAGLKELDIERKFPKFREWLAGDTKPTFVQLQKFAKITHVPLGSLFLSEPPEEILPFSHFRTIDDRTPRRPSGNLIDTLYIMKRRQAWMRDYLIAQGHDPLPFVGTATIRTAPGIVATRMRDALGFEPQWTRQYPTWETALVELRTHMEQAGVLVFVNGVVGNNTSRRLEVDEFRGFVLIDEYAPLVFINNADGKAAQMFTLAHELAHVMYGSSAAFDLHEMQAAQDEIEQACNHAAAEFLMPEDALREIWDKARARPNPYQPLARHFKVSALVAARRALDAKLIGKEDFVGFYRKWRHDERNRTASVHGGGNFYNNQNLRLGKRFALSVIRQAKSGRMPYLEAYRLTQLHGNTFEKYASHLEASADG